MQWKNVKLIYLREMRDQLRDRRTLFLIAVLPILLYPLLGASLFQLSQFMQHHAAKVLVIGASELNGMEWLPRLLDEREFDAQLFDSPDDRENLQVLWPDRFVELRRAIERQSAAAGRGSDRRGPNGEDAALDAAVQELIDEGVVEAALVFPPGFGHGLQDVRRSLAERHSAAAADFPEPIIVFNSANDKSQLAQLRVEKVLRSWRAAVTQKNLVDSDVPKEAAKPFELQPRDVAHPGQEHAAVWSKILPFIVFIWALTGAFYPAVDLCAGEKERGTLETLLTSPALRREIVWGKLLTIMTFSNVTALLNLTSMGVTGKFLVDHLSQIRSLGGENPMAMPSMTVVVWLVAALLPVSALFSALCLACAAFARSTKEGQYYLMPLMLVSMPLMLLPMSPGVELNLGNSLIPLTGVVLLLRSVIEGQYHQALPFVAPVVIVTLVCGLLAIRWAEEQFNRESVLFRESERLQLGRWLVHMVRDRSETPSFAQAMMCIAVIVVVQFFVSVALSTQSAGGLDFPFLVKTVLISQIACVFAPAAIMTVMLTRNPARTLLLERRPKLIHIAAAAALALLLHGPGVRLVAGLGELYPVQPEVQATGEAIQSALDSAPHWWLVLVLLAGLAPICEELAFRGFILSGLRHVGHKWWAIALSAMAFGAVHMFLQQKIAAATIGLAIGYLAVQTESLVPSIVFHAVYNGLQLSAPKWAKAAEGEPHGLIARLLGGDEPLAYRGGSVAICLVAAAAILWSLRSTSYRRTDEEQLEEARQREDAPLVGA